MIESENELIGKIVMTNEGKIFGEICELEIDDETGTTDKITVKPVKDCLTDNEKSNEQIFNSSMFIQVKDIVIIEKD
jgi:sporulation protein YlmC with PRC-barrel domain